jgi:exonuclease SbcD
MRFIHTADWHLGRSFFNVSLINDQAYVLNQVIDIARDSEPDLMVVSGDIYDRALPPTEAIILLDDVLCRLILDLKLPIIIIGGNHDSPLRLEFAARLMETLRLHVFGSLSDRITTIEMFDEWGGVTFCPLPYAEPAYTQEYLHNDGIVSFEDALYQWSAHFKERRPPSSRTVLIHHAFVVGSKVSESERPLDIGGADLVPIACFDEFDYAALGHLHRAQSFGQKDHIHYPGSLLKYSFSEVNQNKCIKLVEMKEGGNCQVETIPLVPLHDVRCIEGVLDDLLQSKIELGNRDDYVQVRLLDSGAVFDSMNRLREVFPNISAIDHPNVIPVCSDINRIDHRERDIIGLFRDFYKFTTSEDLTNEQLAAFSTIANQLREGERLE